MIPGKVYRHRNTLDIDMIVWWTEHLWHRPTHLQAGVRYWNRHYKIFQGEFDIVNMRLSDLVNWTEVPNETPTRSIG